MYEIKEIILKNGPLERKRLVIEFSDTNKQIVGEFLMTDVNLVDRKIVQDIENVLSGKIKEVEFSGNRCYVKVKPDITYLEDLYEEVEGMISYAPYEINTSELLEMIDIWLDRLDALQ